MIDMTFNQNPYNITMPSWIKSRPVPWIYAGWISREADNFDELVKQVKPDHGETRELDFYEGGAAEWYMEPTDAP